MILNRHNYFDTKVQILFKKICSEKTIIEITINKIRIKFKSLLLIIFCTN